MDTETYAEFRARHESRPPTTLSPEEEAAILSEELPPDYADGPPAAQGLPTLLSCLQDSRIREGET